MIKSMTGYGGAKGEVNAIAVTAELKSVNNRFLDVSVRLPKSCLFAEEAVRAAVGSKISRGKVDVFITVDTSQAEEAVIRVNDNLAAAYLKAVRDTAEKYDLDGDISALSLVRFPEVLSTEKSDTDRDLVAGAINAVLAQALEGFDLMRAREGGKLEEDILAKLDGLEDMVRTVEARSPETVKEYREKLYTRMQEVLADRAVELLNRKAIKRFEAAQSEAALFDFDELTVIKTVNREANTTGSKCADSQIARTVIDMKAELEKIREQIQNIE